VDAVFLDVREDYAPAGGVPDRTPALLFMSKFLNSNRVSTIPPPRGLIPVFKGEKVIMRATNKSINLLE